MPHLFAGCYDIYSKLPVSIHGVVAQFFLYADELVVLGHAVGARHAAGLDLPGVGSHGDVGNRVSSVSPERWEVTVL